MNYGRQKIDRHDWAAVLGALRSEHLTQGPLVEDFENAVAKRVGAGYAVAVTNGTAALTIAYQSTGLKNLVTTANTFVATANAAMLANFEKIEFRDISLKNGCWSPPLTAQDATLYVPVHYAGNIAHIPDEIADQTIEDSCHSMTYSGNTLAACFSFHPVKHITTGEGGMIVTNNKDYADDCRKLRDHGRRNGWCEEPSGNYRMNELSAALGLSQLEKMDDFLARRRRLSLLYHNLLAGTPVQRPPENDQPHLYPILAPRRDKLQNWLREHGINTAIHYPPVYLHPVYQTPRNERWNADVWYDSELSLPLHPELKQYEVIYVTNLIKEFYQCTPSL